MKVTYLRFQLNSQPANVKDEIEPAFVHDNSWLIFPFHAYSDSSAPLQDLGTHKLALSNGSARRVAVKYPVRLAVTRRETRGNFLLVLTIESRRNGTARLIVVLEDAERPFLRDRSVCIWQLVLDSFVRQHSRR